MQLRKRRPSSYRNSILRGLG
uniref:Uncharacterized protein n=1 Tax=Rhizophora mucronata TaxID=61149 RepID=A0A2P2P413_RHIMU